MENNSEQEGRLLWRQDYLKPPFSRHAREFGQETIGDSMRWKGMKASIFDLDGTLGDSVYEWG